MDYTKNILNFKNDLFGILWHHGNKEFNDKDFNKETSKRKFFCKGTENFEVGALFEFIKSHKDVLDFQEWSILFKGFLYILYFNFDLVHKESNVLNNTIKKKTKPLITELTEDEAELIENYFEVESSLSLPISKSIKRKYGDNFLIKEPPNLIEADNLDWIHVDNDLADDGFGATLQNIEQNIDRFFKIPSVDDQKYDVFDSNEPLMDTDFFLNSPARSELRFEDDTLTPQKAVPIHSDSNYGLSPNSAAIIGDLSFQLGSPLEQAKHSEHEISELPIFDYNESGALIRPSTSKQDQHQDSLEMREEFIGEDRRSDLQLYASGLLNITENVSDLDANHRLSTPLSFELPTLVSDQFKKRRKKRDRANEEIIIDEVTRFDGNDYFEKLQKYHDKHANRQVIKIGLVPTGRHVEVHLEDAFKMPCVFHSIEPVTNYYITEPRDTDQLEIRKIPEDLEVEDMNIDSSIEHEIGRETRNLTFEINDETRRGIKRRSTLVDESTQLRTQEFEDTDFDQGDITLTTDNQTELIVRNVMDCILDKLSLDEREELEDERRSQFKSRRTTFEQSSRYSEREEHRGTTTAQYYSSFEPVSIQEIDEFQIEQESDNLSQPLDQPMHDNDSCLDDKYATYSLHTNQNLNFSYIQTINNALDEKDNQITFSELTLGFKKSEAAKCFSDLLAMKMSGTIELRQIETYDFGEIYIERII